MKPTARTRRRLMRQRQQHQRPGRLLLCLALSMLLNLLLSAQVALGTYSTTAPQQPASAAPTTTTEPREG